MDLQQFCAEDNPRINEPWSRGEHTFATNGHILIRVPRITDIPDIDGAPDAMRVWEKIPMPPGESAVIPDIPPAAWRVCQTCAEAEGGIIDPECDDCDGDGKFRDTAYTKVGEMSFNDEYLRMIKVLPGYKFYPAVWESGIVNKGSNAPPSVFTFDGGDGLLMPVNV